MDEHCVSFDGKGMTAFRVWEIRWKHMRRVKGVLYDDLGQIASVMLPLIMCPSVTETFALDGKLVLMQSTGFDDRNGNHIYESDILRIYLNKRDKEGKQKTCLGIVKRRPWDTGFEVECLSDTMFPAWYHSDTAYEIIGNIYENSSLLEKKT